MQRLKSFVPVSATQTVRSAAFVPIALVLALCSSTASAESARPRLTQTVDIQIPSLPIPVRIAGKKHLAYELHITNLRPVDVALTRIEVLDADRKSRLGEFSDAELDERLGRPGARPDLADKRVIGAGMRAVFYLWLALDEAGVPPGRLQHRIELDLIRPSGREHAIVEDGASAIRNEPAVVLDAPVRGGPWVALYEPRLVGGHRTSIYTLDGRARIPARFAIDWVKLDNDATHAHGDESRIANWHGYGAEVLAVADGTVAAAVDDMPEDATLPAGAPPAIALENASGNYVTLSLGKGRYAFYEHLKHGSIRVRAGERVKSGQVLALLGNSGSSSSGPHLHFHVSDANSDLAAEGLPYVFRSFQVVGAFETIDAYAKGVSWKSAQEAAGGMRKMELPAANTVVMFGSQ
jgi:murein DD-endopeptidase